MTPPSTKAAIAAPQPRNTILVGDALEQMQQLETGSIDCVITSPPYFRLRNYQHDRQLGLEPTVDDWVTSLAAVIDEAGRLLTPTGTLWLNLGDSYSTHQREGAPQKSLLLGPERLALRLLQTGWTIRNKIVWAKTNAIPSSVTDRLSCAYEVIYLLSRNPRYYFDLDAIRIPAKTHPVAGRPAMPPRQPGRHTNAAPGRAGGLRRTGGSRHPGQRQRRSHANPMPEAWLAPNADSDQGLRAMKQRGISSHPLGKNPGDVWQLASSNYRGAHFATYPESLSLGCCWQDAQNNAAPAARHLTSGPSAAWEPKPSAKPSPQPATAHHRQTAGHPANRA